MGRTIFFENGQVVWVSPEPGCSYYQVREIINKATVIVSDGKRYDLEDAASIRSIKIPNYKLTTNNVHANDLGVTGYLEYVLRMHAGLLWNAGKYDISMECLEKACLLMPHSTISWQQSDYHCVVKENIELGRFKRAAMWRDWIGKNTKSTEDYARDRFDSVLQSCRYLGTNLIEVYATGPCCEICAKYRNRIYRTSFKNHQFPKFPKDFHFRCTLSFSPFVSGCSEPTFHCKNYVSHSRRPFRDDRTEEEKENYVQWVEMLEKRNSCSMKADLNHLIYYWLKQKFPDDLPKSLSGFSRMRNSNSANYQKLVKKIEAAGYKIPQSLDEVIQFGEENN